MYKRQVLLPGLVIFSAFSDSLIFGTNWPVALSITAASLYTPPKDGQSLAVIRLVPTPQELMVAPCIFRELIRFSSRSLEAETVSYTHLSDYITKKVADKLSGMCKTDRENYEKYCCLLYTSRCV